MSMNHNADSSYRMETAIPGMSDGECTETPSRSPSLQPSSHICVGGCRCYQASCKVCLDLRWELIESPAYTQYTEPYRLSYLKRVRLELQWSTLQISSQHNCRICLLLYEGIQVMAPQYVENEWEDPSLVLSGFTGSNPRVEVDSFAIDFFMDECEIFDLLLLFSVFPIFYL